MHRQSLCWMYWHISTLKEFLLLQEGDLWFVDSFLRFLAMHLISRQDGDASIREASSVRFDAVCLCFGLIGFLPSALNHCSFLSWWEASSSLPASSGLLSSISVAAVVCAETRERSQMRTDWQSTMIDCSKDGIVCIQCGLIEWWGRQGSTPGRKSEQENKSRGAKQGRWAGDKQ